MHISLREKGWDVIFSDLNLVGGLLDDSPILSFDLFNRGLPPLLFPDISECFFGPVIHSEVWFLEFVCVSLELFECEIRSWLETELFFTFWTSTSPWSRIEWSPPLPLPLCFFRHRLPVLEKVYLLNTGREFSPLPHFLFFERANWVPGWRRHDFANAVSLSFGMYTCYITECILKLLKYNFPLTHIKIDKTWKN